MIANGDEKTIFHPATLTTSAMKTAIRLFILALFATLLASEASAHYNARLGRWLSRDPIGEAGGFNLYAYCGNDPVNRWDYLGLDESSEKWPTGKNTFFRLAFEGERRGQIPTCKRINLATGRPEVWANFYEEGTFLDHYTGAGWVDATSLNFPAFLDANFFSLAGGKYAIKSLQQHANEWAGFNERILGFNRGVARGEAKAKMAYAPIQMATCAFFALETFGTSLWGVADGADRFRSAKLTLETDVYHDTVLERASRDIGGNGLGGTATHIALEVLANGGPFAFRNPTRIQQKLAPSPTVAANSGGKLYHYTGEANVGGILEKGLVPGRSGQVFTTPNGTLTPLQAQIELALPANRGLPGAMLEIDAAGLQRAGIAPSLGPLRVQPTPNAPGGGVETIFNQAIPPQFIRRVP